MPLESAPLKMVDLPVPVCGPSEILIKVSACGVCHTELDQIEKRITPPRLPVILGHQITGIVEDVGCNVKRFKKEDRAGAAWFYSSCGKCSFCKKGLSNLCDNFMATGYHADGGYAEYFVIHEDNACIIPYRLTDLYSAAPLLCAGAVGYRSLKLSGMKNGYSLGLYGFGSANHLVIQMAKYMFPGSKKFVITRNPSERELALKLGADWAGDIEDKTPEKLDCAIDTTPAWKPVIFALENLNKGGRLVLNLISKEERDKEYLLNLDYRKHLWLEKEVKTVANVTAADAQEILDMAPEANICPRIKTYRLKDANTALADLKSGRFTGSKILKIN
ncbi:MAG: alcohol dehydrogenase [Actinobacteria bacterium]|nr:alcohol dehydrogenase [Actinomycetota bacterium]